MLRLPHDLGATYVIVSGPNYSLELLHDGRVICRSKIIVGEPTKPTPLLSARR